MIVDADRIATNQRTETSFIIGAGAAGIPAAAELERAGMSVLLVESGGMRRSRSADALSQGRTLNPQHAPLDRYRVRALGGTTKVWGGRVAPLDELDFRNWPISRADLDPFYRQAHRYLNVGDFDYSAQSVQLEGATAVERPLTSCQFPQRHAVAV